MSESLMTVVSGGSLVSGWKFDDCGEWLEVRWLCGEWMEVSQLCSEWEETWWLWRWGWSLMTVVRGYRVHSHFEILHGWWHIRMGIIGVNCHKYQICCNKSFVTLYACCDKGFVMPDIFLSQQNLLRPIFVPTNMILLPQKFCHDNFTFVATKVGLSQQT